MTELLKFKYFYLIFLSFITLTVVTSNKISADQKIRITADEMQIEKDKEACNLYSRQYPIVRKDVFYEQKA